MINLNIDFNTAFGKAIKTAAWVAISAVASYFIAFFAKDPNFFNPLVVGIINIALVSIKNVADPNVKNI